jgi:hypothetical protein
MSGAEPFLIAALVASTATASYGAWYSGKAQENAYKAQADAAKVNAEQIELNAQAAAAAGNQREEIQRRRMRALEATSVAAIANTGTRIEGSNLDLIGQNRVFGELDALNIRYETELQRSGLMAQAGMERYSGRVAGMNASTAGKAAVINAGSALLSGATQGYIGYKGIQKTG